MHLSFNILTCFCLCEINPGFSLFTGLGYIDGADSIVPFNLWKTIAAFIEVDRKQQVRSIGDSGSQSFSSEMVSKRARGINMVSDSPFTNIVQGSDYNEHDAFEDHGKGNITDVVSDPPFTNLFQRSDNNRESILIG